VTNGTTTTSAAPLLCHDEGFDSLWGASVRCILPQQPGKMYIEGGADIVALGSAHLLAVGEKAYKSSQTGGIGATSFRAKSRVFLNGPEPAPAPLEEFADSALLPDGMPDSAAAYVAKMREDFKDDPAIAAEWERLQGTVLPSNKNVYDTTDLKIEKSEAGHYTKSMGVENSSKIKVDVWENAKNDMAAAEQGQVKSRRQQGKELRQEALQELAQKELSTQARMAAEAKLQEADTLDPYGRANAIMDELQSSLAGEDIDAKAAANKDSIIAMREEGLLVEHKAKNEARALRTKAEKAEAEAKTPEARMLALRLKKQADAADDWCSRVSLQAATAEYSAFDAEPKTKA